MLEGRWVWRPWWRVQLCIGEEEGDGVGVCREYGVVCRAVRASEVLSMEVSGVRR